MPSRKWFAQQVTAIGAWVVALIEADWVVNDTLQISAVGLVVAALVSWLVRNTQADKDRQQPAGQNG